MKNYNVWRIGGCAILALLALAYVCLPASAQVKEEKKPGIEIKITIDSVPTDAPSATMALEPIKGTVAGANPKEQKVVIYARGGTTWWVQPTAESPLTDFGEDGKWESETHGGTDFVALLVKSSYKAKGTLTAIPVVGGDILAKSDPVKPKK